MVNTFEVEKILRHSQNSFPSPSSNRQQTVFMFVDNTQQCFALLPPMIWIFTEGEGDGIDSRLSSSPTCLFFLNNVSSNGWAKY